MKSTVQCALTVVGPTYNTAMHHCILYNSTGIIISSLFGLSLPLPYCTVFTPHTYHTTHRTVLHKKSSSLSSLSSSLSRKANQIKSSQVKSKSRSNLFISLPVRVGVRGIFKMFDKFFIETQREASSCCTQGS